MAEKITSSAQISSCGLYRYFLLRRWAMHGKTCAFVMLNPSTADARQDDPTIRRCIRFAQREGCSAMLVVNLFGFRATDPRELRNAADPHGPENVEWVRHAVAQARATGAPVIAAWGANPMVGNASPHVFSALGDAMCLGMTKAGSPRHPLYVRGDQPLEPWRA